MRSAFISLSLLLTAIFLMVLAAGNSNVVWANGFACGAMRPENETARDVIHVSPREIEGENVVSLQELSDYFGWSFEVCEDTKEVTIASSSDENSPSEEETSSYESESSESESESAEGDQDMSRATFVIGADEFSGRELKTSPFEYEGEVFVGADMTRLLIGELQDQRIKFISWLEADRNEYEKGDEVEVNMALWNVSGRNHTLNFNTGQVYDLKIVDMENDEEVWRWSDGRAFTMALQEISLAAGELKNWQETFSLDEDIAAGKYSLSGKIVSSEGIPFNTREVKIR